MDLTRKEKPQRSGTDTLTDLDIQSRPEDKLLFHQGATIIDPEFTNDTLGIINVNLDRRLSDALGTSSDGPGRLKGLSARRLRPVQMAMFSRP